MDNTRYFTAYRGLYFYYPMHTCIHLFSNLIYSRNFCKTNFLMSTSSKYSIKLKKTFLMQNSSREIWNVLYYIISFLNRNKLYYLSLFDFHVFFPYSIIQKSYNQIRWVRIYFKASIYFLYWPYNNWYTIYIYTNEYSSASILHVIDHGDFTIPSPQ